MSKHDFQKSKYNKIIFKFLFCHRLPDRTFKINGWYLPVCSRCTGLYIGAMLFFTYSLFSFIEYSMPLILMALIITFPLVIDGTTQYLGFRESNNKLRFITGFTAGLGSALLITILKITIF